MIDARKLEEALKHALFYVDELDPDKGFPDGAVVVEGMMAKFGLHPGRLEEARPLVVEAIAQLDSTFLDGPGGGQGYTFLNLPFDRQGEQWGEQRDADVLLVLAIGLGLGQILVPREMWSMFPGGVPYVGFKVTA